MLSSSGLTASVTYLPPVQSPSAGSSPTSYSQPVYGSDHGMLNGLARTLPLVSNTHAMNASSYAPHSYDAVKVEEDGYLSPAQDLPPSISYSTVHSFSSHVPELASWPTYSSDRTHVRH
ncbi:hypothetical protein OF83DRAFT_203749 [Amylostereum chailletii]|nr:hypothetical protein OF83DRAFT_203749 [Amylostereum chailletii]